MPLTFGACDSTAGTDNAGNMGYAILVDVILMEVLKGLEQRLIQSWILKPTAHVNVCRPSTARTTTCKDAMNVALEREVLRSSSNTARESKLVTAWLRSLWMVKWTEHIFVNAATRILLVSYFYARLTRDCSFAKHAVLIWLSSVSLSMSSSSNEIFSISQLVSFLIH